MLVLVSLLLVGGVVVIVVGGVGVGVVVGVAVGGVIFWSWRCCYCCC